MKCVLASSVAIATFTPLVWFAMAVPDTLLIVQVNEVLPWAPVVSVAVTTTLNGLPVVVLGVPVMMPVLGAMASPVGSPVAV